MWLWFHKLGSPPYAYRLAARFRPSLFWGALGLMLVAGYGALVLAPADYQQKDAFRIIYVHAPAAIMSLQVYVVMAISAAVGIIWRIKIAHAVAAACASRGRMVHGARACHGLDLRQADVGHVVGVGPAHHLRADPAVPVSRVMALRALFDDTQRADRASAVQAIVGVVNEPIRVLIGAHAKDVMGENSGAANMFRRDGDVWTEEAKLSPADGSDFDEFGIAVSISGSTAVVGADVDDDRGENSGSAYLFAFDGSQWTEGEKLAASDGEPYDYFGIAVAISASDVLVGAGGDDEQIALLTEEQSDYIITGDKYARRAVLATGVACHTASFNWRHTDGRLPIRAQMTGKNTNSNNAKWPANEGSPEWDPKGSHVPFVGVVPFLCHPSPCFIEIAQKEFCWHATNFGSLDAATHPYDEVRSRGWRLRNYAGAIFLTPDSDYDGTGRKASAKLLDALRSRW